MLPVVKCPGLIAEHSIRQYLYQREQRKYSLRKLKIRAATNICSNGKTTIRWRKRPSLMIEKKALMGSNSAHETTSVHMVQLHACFFLV